MYNKKFEKLKNAYIYELNNNAGLWKPRDSFYLDNDIPKKLDFVLKIFLYKLYQEFQKGGKNLSPNDIANAIIKTLKYRKLYNFKDDNFYPIMQHIFHNLYNDVIFDIQILIDITKGRINYSHFGKTFKGPLMIFEAITLIENYNDLFFENKDNISITAQNHHRSDELLDFKDECYRQIKQPYADFRIEIPNKLIFLDVKTKTSPIDNVGLFKGSVCLTINHNYKKSYIDKLLQDFSNVIINKIKAAKDEIEKKAQISLKNAKNEKENSKILEEKELKLAIISKQKEAYNILLNKLDTIKKNSLIIDEKYALIKKEIQKVMLDPDLNLIYFSSFANYMTEEQNLDIENNPFSAVEVESINNEAHFPKNGITPSEKIFESTLNEYIEQAIKNEGNENRQLLITFLEKYNQL